MGVAAETWRRYLLCCQTSADLMPPFIDSYAHISVLDEVHGKEQRLVTSSYYYNIKRLFSHYYLLAFLCSRLRVLELDYTA